MIFSPGGPVEPLANEPVERVRPADALLDVQARIYDQEAQAYMWAAWMKHQRNLLEIILDGMNHA